MLQIKGLRTCFRTEIGLVPAVDGIDLNVDKGQAIGLVGESGCGKTVTALSIMRLIKRPGEITEGTVLLDGIDLLGLDETAMRSVRGKRIAMIFQEPMTSLNPVLTVGDQIREALMVHDHLTRSEAREKVLDTLHAVGIADPDKRYKAYPHELSGGMRQRVMIAMSLVCKPDLLIADEPTSALDVTIQAQIIDLIDSLRDKHRMAMLLISHDFGILSEAAERVAVMYAGRIVENGSVREILDDPLHPYSSGLLASIPTLEKNRAEPLTAIRGVVPTLTHMPAGCKFAPRCDRAVVKCWETEPALFSQSDGRAVRCWLV